MAEKDTTKTAGLWDIYNFTEVDSRISSAGHPEDSQFSQVADAGFQVLINLVPYQELDKAGKLGKIARDLGMVFVHIPVVWESPTSANVDAFFVAMDKVTDKRVFVHCQANMRASAFLYLYRTMRLSVPVAQAKGKMNEIWVPEGVWQELLDTYSNTH